MAFVFGSSPPPAPAPARKKEGFPYRSFLVTFLAGLGLFYYAAFRLPEVPVEGNPTVGVLVSLGRGAALVAPFLALLLGAPLLPALFMENGKRKYLVRLAALFTVLLIGLYAVAEHPFERLTETVQSALNQSRDLSPDKAGRG